MASRRKAKPAKTKALQTKAAAKRAVVKTKAKTPVRQAGPYTRDLDKNPANYQPLSPLTFLERAAFTFPKTIAIIHGRQRTTYEEFYARTRRLASALKKRKIGLGDTVAVIAPNVPAML